MESVYEKLCEMTGTKKTEIIAENLDKNLTSKKFSINSIFDALSASISPAIPAILACGFIKVILLLCEQFGLLVSTDETYQVLTFIYNAGFYFLPILVAYGASKRFHMETSIALTLAGILISPSILELIDTGMTSIHLFGIPLPLSDYTSTIFPILLTVVVGSYLEKYLKKFIPSVIKTVAVPFLCLFIMVPIELAILAPLGSYIGNGVAVVFTFIYEKVGFLAAGLLCAFVPYLIMTGMHVALVPYVLQMFSTLGCDPTLLVAGFIGNFSQGAACLAVALKAKDNELKELAWLNVATVFIGGITEPAMYGITMKYKKPMFACMIGNFCGGVFAGIMHVGVYAIAGTYNLLTLSAFVGPEFSNLIYGIIAIVISCVVTFILTLVFGFEEMK